MIGEARVLAVITARGGSRGLPGKNIRPLAGRPLIGWTIAAAHESALIDRTVLSTDDPAIADAARRCNCEVPFMRDAALAADDTSSIDVMLDVLDRIPGYDIAVLLQPTSPLRTARDIDDAIRACVSSAAPSCVSVCEAEESPYWMYRLEADGRMNPLLASPNNARRRQDLPAVHVLNGAVYVARVDVLRRERAFVVAGTVGYPMPKERSVDIDLEQDLLVAEKYLTGQTK